MCILLPNMDANEINEQISSSLTKKHLLEKNKGMILMDDFSLNFLRYMKDPNSFKFLD